MEVDENENQKKINNILSRNNSGGFSYFRCNEGSVPFQWEKQPGIPKHPQQEHIPPLTPPPAILSSNLPKLSMSDHPHLSKPSSSSRWSSKLRFWKRKAIVQRKQTRSSKKVREEGSSQECDDSVDVFAGVETCLGDRESMAVSSLPFDSSFSVFSSSASSSRSLSPIRGIYGKPLSCFSMHMSKIQVSFVRRH